MSDVLKIQPTTLSDRRKEQYTLRLSEKLERPNRLNMVHGIGRSHSTLGDRRKKQDSLGLNEELEKPNRLNVVLGLGRSNLTLIDRRKEQDILGVSEELESPNRLNVVPSIGRSYSTLDDRRKKQDTLGFSEELERRKRLNVVPAIGRSHSTLGDRRKKQDSRGVSEELEKPNVLNLMPDVFRIQSTYLSDRSKEQAALREIIVKNWILVKDNSSPFSWWKEFKEMDFLPISAFTDLDKKTTNIERRDLAELLLIKALQKDVCTSEEKIEVLKKIILKGLENELIQKREHALIGSDDKKLNDCFKRNKKEWEKCLNRQDVIKIKDHLLQEDFITFEDNEKLVNDDNYYKRSKEHLFSQIVQKVDEKKGPFQCFIRHAENIIRQKQSGQKLLQKITSQPLNRMQPAKRSVSITSKVESFAESDKHKGQQYKLSLTMKDEKEKEETGAYQYVEKNADTVDVVFHKTLGASCDEISLGSIVIHFHPLDRDTCCKFDGHFVKLIHKLLQEVILKSTIPSGKYTLTAEVNVTHNLNKTASEFKPLTDEINFVTAEKSFLVEEIDVDAVFAGFKMQNIAIESINQTGCRQNNARDLLNSIIKNHLEYELICILRKYKMTYILNRYEIYMHVYESETSVLRRKIIKNFSSIMECIDIDDIREVLLDREVIKESTLNELVFKFENRRDFAMATLIIECLKSGNAIHAFAYALYLQEYNPLLVNNSNQESQGKSDADEEDEIGTYPVEDSRQMYSGCFNITIGSEDVRDGAVSCNKEKRLQFPVSAFNIGFPYQQPDARTNYDMIHPLNNRYNKALHGISALPLSARPYKEYQCGVSCRLLNAGSPNRARTTITNDVAGCANDRILNNNDELSEMALSPAITACATGSGYSARRETIGYMQRIRSPVSTLGSKDSGDSIEFEEDRYIHRVRSSASTIVTKDSGDSTQLEADSYIPRIRSPASSLGTTDSGYSTQLEADGYTHMICSPASSLGTKDSGDSTQLKTDVSQTGSTHLAP